LLNAFKSGLLKVNANLKFLILVWIINLSFAALLTGPIYILLKESLSKSVLGMQIIHSFDIQWFAELEYRFSDIIKFMPTILIMVGIIYALIQVFLVGGVLEVLNSKASKNLFIDFFYGCVRYFFRFFKVFLISLVCYAGLYYLNLVYIKYIEISSITSESQFVQILANSIRYIVIIVLFGILNIIFDYVRIRIVVNQSYRIFEDIWFTFKFIIKNFFNVSLLFLLLASIGTGIFLLYALIDTIFNPDTVLLIILLFFIRQIYIVGKIWTKLLFYSTQLELFKELTAPVIPLEAHEINIPVKGD
jgi:hypothetical protein